VAVWDDHTDQQMVEAASDAGVDLLPTPSAASLAEALRHFELLVPSPGVPGGHPVLAAASHADLEVRSEIDLVFDLPGAERPAVLAVTGTNGKTTVTNLATAMLARSGISALAAGNIGLPLVDAATSGAAVVVAEVSSFQLEFTRKFHPIVSCWLNLEEDHLDWHGSMAAYGAAKARIWALQGPGDTAVVNADDQAVAMAARSIPGGVSVTWFSSRKGPGYRVKSGSLVGPDGAVVIDVADMPRALPHDISNSLAALAVASSAGADAIACAQALRETLPLPHRVALVGTRDGVAWYDDSKATTPASVRAAVAGFQSVVLIAGGRNKGLDLGVLSMLVPPVRAAVGIGESAGEVLRAFEGLVPVTTASNMEDAVEAAAHLARQGDAVVLSPGCASFDWYRSYVERGDHFSNIVKRRLDREEQPC
jgi:UDP-N-acetylmuramoylalanine--D-glutamate ligase